MSNPFLTGSPQQCGDRSRRVWRDAVVLLLSGLVCFAPFEARADDLPDLLQNTLAGNTVDFGNEIVPLLSRYGCNSGGCHGKASGQNGFKLSLFGFDQAFDHDAIAKEDRGRRLFPAVPEESLLLKKAAGAMPHGGGVRFARDSEAYRLIRTWIANGAPVTVPDAPRIVTLTVTPPEQILTADSTQPLIIEATYSDGAKREVTSQAEYSSNLDPVASVNADGVVKATGQSGEAAIMARYMGHVAVFRAVVPHGVR